MHVHIRTNKYNKLILAQHLDDLVESFMMSALHNGQVSASFYLSGTDSSENASMLYPPHCVNLIPYFTLTSFCTYIQIQVRTMKANYKIEAGDVRVIRPLIYVREHMTRDFSQTSKLPIINENCPACFEQPKVSTSLAEFCSVLFRFCLDNTMSTTHACLLCQLPLTYLVFYFFHRRETA